ncbi:MAG: M23 family metallopeptidase [Spirochaetaceae bacterium]|jgi:murein DD-endopeptidase MepM/ murein hydrolase activator NlpD|nr:M23 family metallopeptidase [Spirochaetaceae bacterium]GMO26979.1 MAG: M23 family metallopeptidase [Termitinemataceae bacterium]
MMNEIKELEKRFARQLKNNFFIIIKYIAHFFKSLGRLFIKQRYTVIFIPHSEKKFFSFNINLFTVLCFLCVLFTSVGFMFFYYAPYNNKKSTLAEKDIYLNKVQADYDIMLDETDAFIQEAVNFENILSKTFSIFSVNIEHDNDYIAPDEDLKNFISVKKENDEVQLNRIEYLHHFSEYMEAAAEPMREIGARMIIPMEFSRNIPSIWPIKDGIGIITSYFGPRRHPVTGVRDFHDAIDIAARHGIPIIATADGQVVLAGYDSRNGNNIVIWHKYGYYTRYAHMNSYNVHSGQMVRQGEVIGYVGSTGLSTGPHLHYQVRMGSAVMDPYYFINMAKK